MSPLGVTQLLNELLSEQETRNGCLGTSEDEEHGFQGDLGDSNLELEQEVARQIKDLAGEMDDCLASLEQWKAQRRRENEAMDKELEALHRETLLLEASTAEDEDRLFSQEEDEEQYPCEPIEDVKPVKHQTLPVDSSRHFSPLDLEMARADEERIANLRAEVERLRLQAAASECEVRGTFDEEMELPDTSTLSQWCSEVDNALNGESTVAELEDEMFKAYGRVGDLEGGLEAARARVDAELRELEEMLAECDVMKAKIQQHES